MKVKLFVFLGLIIALSLSISNLAFPASIFSVVGTVRNADGTLASTGLAVTVTNQTRGLTDITTVGEQEVGKYGVVFVDMGNKMVADEEDTVNVTIRDADEVIATVIYQLTADDIAKGRAIVDVEIGSAPKPEASFTYSPQLDKYLSGQKIIFEAAESENIVSYDWDFGNGETYTGTLIHYRYRGEPDKSTTYIVTLAVKDGTGYTDTYAMDITVVPIEKNAEIVYELIGEPTTIGAKVWYSWVGTDQEKNVYKVSKIDDWNSYFVGYYDVSIENKERALWSKRIIATPVQGKPYAPEQLLIVGDEDWLSVKAYGVTELEVANLASIILSMTSGLPPVTATLPYFTELATTYLAPDYVDTSDYPLIDIEDVELAPLTIGYLASPGELRVYDSKGHITGLVNGEVREEIPDSAYFNDTVVILSASSSYRYEVMGTEEGTYGLEVTTVENEKANAFAAIDIPTTVHALHQYTIDWDALSKSEEGVTIKIDENGDLEPERTITSDSELTQDEYLFAMSVNPNGKLPTTWADVKRTQLFQNYPNPFNPDTWIPYTLAEQARAVIKIQATTGQLVKILTLGEKPAGIYISKNKAAYWDGRDDDGEPVASGVYFYTLRAGDYTATKKMIIAK